MITVDRIDKALSEIAPPSLSESWDNDGVMLCKSLTQPVKKVLVMLEVSDRGIAAACEGGYDLIVTHHPFVFHPLGRLVDENYRFFDRLMRSEIAVLSYHTRMDAAVGGVNDAAVKLLGWKQTEPFGGETGCGRVGILHEPLSPTAFAAKLKEVLGCSSIRASLFADPNRKIRRAAFVGGAGKSFYAEAFAAGAEAFVTGEAAHNTFIDCAALDMCLFDCGHYYTENPVCMRIKELLDEAFENALVVDTFDVKSPYVSL